MGQHPFTSADEILHICSAKGVDNGIHFSLRIGGNVNSINPVTGRTPLQLATENNHLDVVELLIEIY